MKLYYKAICSLIFSLLSLSASADNTLSGFVYTRSTGESLPYANVIIKGTTIGTATTTDGSFSLAGIETGTYTVTASYSGFLSQEIQIEVKEDTRLDFYLEETSYDINAVVVTGTRTEKTLKNVPILTNVVSRREIESTGAKSINDALSLSLPNIRFNSSSAGVSMQLAGLEAKYTVFLIDGEKISGETNGNIDYNRIKTADIERIEIVKGASGLLYGSNAIGGVVNIITSKPNQGFEASIGSQYSKYNTLDTDASIGFVKNKFSSKSSFYANSTDGYDFTPSDYGRTQEAFNSKSLKQKFEYKSSDKLNFELFGSYYDRLRFNSETPNNHKKDYDLSYNIKSTYRYNTLDNISLIWHSDSYTTKDVEALFDDRETTLYQNTYSNARLSGTFSGLNKNAINAGFEYIEDRLVSDRVDGQRKRITNAIFYLQDEIEFSDRLTAIAGARANYHSENGFHAVPQISTMFKLESLKLRAGYSMGFRSPSIKELYMDFSPVPIVSLYGNPDLVPETARYLSLSAEYSKSIFNASVSLYQNHIKNMITEVQDLVDPRIWVYENINQVKVQGLDFNLRAKLKYGFSLNASYSFTDSEDQTSGDQMLGTSKNNGALMLQHRHTWKNYELAVNLMANAYGEVPFNEMDELTGEISSELYKAHTIWKLTTTHNIYSGIILTLGVDNIFNVYELENIMNLNPGRRYFVGLRLNIHKLDFKGK